MDESKIFIKSSNIEDFSFIQDRVVVILWRSKDGELNGTPCKLSDFFINVLESNKRRK